MTYETFFVGIILAALYVEIMDIYPGGIIVPAYLALFLDQPLRILVTVTVALLSLVSYRFLSRSLILFGRRRFVMLILLGALWGQAWFLLAPHIYSGPAELRVIGWVIPGLLANNLERQKFFQTLASLFTVSVLVYFVMKLVTKFFLH
jgi:poly-gamma-glutamate biosynthesis protein PgsC/CapC